MSDDVIREAKMLAYKNGQTTVSFWLMAQLIARAEAWEEVDNYCERRDFPVESSESGCCSHCDAREIVRKSDAE